MESKYFIVRKVYVIKEREGRVGSVVPFNPILLPLYPLLFRQIFELRVVKTQEVDESDFTTKTPLTFCSDTYTKVGRQGRGRKEVLTT